MITKKQEVLIRQIEEMLLETERSLSILKIMIEAFSEKQETLDYCGAIEVLYTMAQKQLVMLDVFNKEALEGFLPCVKT